MYIIPLRDLGNNMATNNYANAYTMPSAYSGAVSRWIYLLTPGRRGYNFKFVILKYISRTGILGTSCKIALRWM